MPERKRQRIQSLIDTLSQGLQEREQTVAIALLGALTGQNTFLYGPPGTAKSLLARRIASAFNHDSYFECLMNRFSTPEEVFGPVSIQALKQDQYHRKTQGYLPTVDFAFLDEIWKSSPAILNTLLTLINERLFRNGDDIEPVPLKALIAASNEVPEPDQGLDALYDRFLIRLMAQPTSQWDNFASLLQSRPVSAEVDIAPELKISNGEWLEWQQQLHQVQLSDDCLGVIKILKQQLQEQAEALGLYVSDRRWQRAAMLLKASAFFNDRDHTNLSDALLLKHCLWAQEEDHPKAVKLVHDAIFALGCPQAAAISELYQQIDDWETALHTLLFHQEDVYETVDFYPQQYFFGGSEERQRKNQSNFFYVKAMATYQHGLARREPVYLDFYVHQEQMKSPRPFHPMDTLGKAMETVQCRFDEHGAMDIKYNDSGNFDSNAYVVNRFKPTVKFRQGERREKRDEAALNQLLSELDNSHQLLTRTLAEVTEFQQHYQHNHVSPFVTEAETDVVHCGLLQQLGDLELNIMKCQQLQELSH
ncbi:AAA family ATPase [Ferrimonas sp. SCSIO 43195]|uniref:AAA family ATPase n=1 Tax=Ferrimonas sp. SCSIO 43195 TaxID=2822844 RepID=UPI002075E4B6|nr:AAA family ATPase [Ferrimonas sp. SCSIO 43195]USD35676.1 AAA family ATPase [Ferrimonas sp. SCSIO 43195]